MFLYMLNSMPGMRLWSGPHAVLPGDPMPEWLERQSKQRQMWEELKAGDRKARNASGQERKFLGRLRLAGARE